MLVKLFIIELIQDIITVFSILEQQLPQHKHLRQTFHYCTKCDISWRQTQYCLRQWPRFCTPKVRYRVIVAKLFTLVMFPSLF